MIDATAARRTMVDNQIRPSDVTDHRVIDAFAAVPREVFVPAALRSLAYIDEHLQVKAASGAAPARFLMQPAPFAKLVQLAAIERTDRVLVVGAGTGYAAAIAATLGGDVVALEEDAELAEAARANLRTLGLDRATVVTGPLPAGAPARAPFDVILFDGSIEVLPDAFAGQLAEGGRLVSVEGRGLAGKGRLHRRVGDELSGRSVFNCAARPLPGFEKAAEFQF